jgi:hypothetical protein
MRSHFVPKMYLKAWQVTHDGRQKQICVYKKGQKPEFRSIRRQVGWREDYYTEEAEKRLDRELESKTEPLLNKLIQENALSTTEKIQLSRFLLVLWFRVPFSIEGLFRDIRKHTLPATLQQLNKLKEALKDLNLPNEVFDYERFKSPEHEKYIYSKLILRNKYRQDLAFARMHWRVYKAAPGKEFVTSDNPVFLDRRIGLGNPNSYFIFPISPQLILEGNFTKKSGNYLEPVDVAKTEQLNREIIRNCDQEVYGSINDIAIAKLVDDCSGDARAIKHEINIRF